MSLRKSIERTRVAAWLASAFVFGFAPAGLAQNATPPAPAAPAAPATAADGEKKEGDEDLTKASGEVAVKKELKVLEEVFKRRAALQYLKGDKGARDQIVADLDPESAAAIKSLTDDDTVFTNLDYHFIEKMKNCEDRVLYRMRKDQFQGIEDLLESVKDKQYPTSAAFANVMNLVEMNFRYALRKGLISDAEFAKDIAARLTSETVRINGTAGHAIDEIAKAFWKDSKPDQFPAYWFDPSSGPISYEFGKVPEAPAYPTVDLNTATRDQLLAIPNVESEIADAITAYAKKNGFQGPAELRLVPEVPKHLIDPLETVCSASPVSKKKQWTVMVYLNAANNLEPCGIDDVNEMEKIGSTRDVNVVVQLDRYKGHEKRVQPNPQYFRNPYSEFEHQFYVGLNNAPGSARFYVLKDDDPVRVQSVVKGATGEADAGRPEHLADFGKWAVENFPAEHYALVIWNHGAGWSGVSYDENTNHGLDLPEVRTALEQICGELKKQDKPKLDVLDFDACLMATLEVAYELRDTVDYLAASQETEPGDGMPYDDYLKWLVTYPEAPPASFAKAMVDTYVKSYMPKGSQVEGDMAFLSETKSAMRLSKIAELKSRIETFAAAMLERPALIGEVAEEVVGDARRFGRLVDIQDFLKKIQGKAKNDIALKAAVDSVIDLIGYPTTGVDKLVNEVIIKRRSAGAVVWGYNNWQSPPRSLAPFVHQSKYAKTPLVGPDDKGNYVAKIQFPPMLFDPKTKKPVAITQIDYRFEDEQEKRTVKDFVNNFITTDFAPDGVVIAEGHLVSNNRSHGVSLYFPSYLGFDSEYLRLQFAKDSKWVELCNRFPMKKLENPAPVAMLGINHATKADRDELGKIVVKDAYKDAIRKYDFASRLSGDLTKLGFRFDSIRDPRPYGEDWEQFVGHWQDGVVILDNHDGLGSGGGNPFGYLSSSFPSGPQSSGPEGRTVMRLLSRGGRLLLSTPAATAATWDLPLYRDTLGLTYGERWDLDYKFKSPSATSAKIAGDKVFTITPARKGAPIQTFTGGDGVTPFCVLENGKMIGAKIAREDKDTKKAFRAVVLGFYLSDVANDDDRRLLVEEALAFLNATPAPKEAEKQPIGAAAPTPKPPAAAPPAEAGTGSRDH